LATMRFDQGDQFGVGRVAAPLVLDLGAGRSAASQMTSESSAM
jgi:hypothetical protein